MKLSTVAVNLSLIINLCIPRHRRRFLCCHKLQLHLLVMTWWVSHVFQCHRGPASSPTHYLKKHC